MLKPEYFTVDIYEKIIDQLRDIVLILDTAGGILRVNQTAVQVYGYTQQEFEQMHIEVLRAPEKREQCQHQFEEACKEGLRFRTMHQTRSGVEFPVEVNSKKICLQGHEIVVSVVRDIANIVKIEKFLKEKEEKLQSSNQDLLSAYEELTASTEELQQQFEDLQRQDLQIMQQNSYLQVLHETTQSLMSGSNVDEVLQNLLLTAARLVGAPHGAIYQVDRETKTFMRSHGVGVYADQTGIVIPTDNTIIGMVYESETTVIVNEYAQFRQKYPTHALLFEFSAVLLIPLLAEGVMVGTIGLAYREEGKKFGRDEEEALNLFAELASIALDNAKKTSSLLRELQVRKHAERELRFLNRKYKIIFDKASDGMLLYDMRKKFILEWNTKAGELLRSVFGCREDEIPTRELFQSYIDENVRRSIRLAVRGREQLFDYRIKGIVEKCFQVGLKKIVIGDDHYFLAIFRDITEKWAQEQKILSMAYYDDLTGLLNRQHFYYKLQEMLEQVKDKSSAGGAVFFIDLDDFKSINDTLGHSYGDTVIKKVGQNLRQAVAQYGTVARIGGDEFSVLIPEITDIGQIRKLAEKVLASIHKNYVIQGSLIYISASLGIALYPEHGETREEIYKNADIAMYKAKAGKKNTWALFQYAWEEEAFEKMKLKRGLVTAVKNREFFLVYQPVVSSRNEEIIGFETLIRWEHPQYGVISPAKFIPIAEEMDVINEIGDWILQEVCDFVAQLRACGKNNLVISMNLSPAQFGNTEFSEKFIDKIAQSDMDDFTIEFEITENVLIESMEESCLHLEKFRQAGFGVALDDFGTGYSSLTYLRKLPVTKLKIDKSFIESTTDAEEFHLLKSIVDMAHGLHLIVVAEGVETEKQLDMVRKAKCDYIQGYFYSRPLVKEKALAYVRR